MSKNVYEVIVGNIGFVYRGNNVRLANQIYFDYVELSKRGYGRVGGEDVTIFKNDEIRREHIGTDALGQVARGVKFSHAE